MQQERFLLEKDIQQVVEANLVEIFNLPFVASELTVEKFRVDTLAFDEESNSFVIIEYKKGNSYSVVDQGYSYLSVMLNNKADFILEYNERLDQSLRRDDVDCLPALAALTPIHPNLAVQYQMCVVAQLSHAVLLITTLRLNAPTSLPKCVFGRVGRKSVAQSLSLTQH